MLNIKHRGTVKKEGEEIEAEKYGAFLRIVALKYVQSLCNNKNKRIQEKTSWTLRKMSLSK